MSIHNMTEAQWEAWERLGPDSGPQEDYPEVDDPPPRDKGYVLPEDEVEEYDPNPPCTDPKGHDWNEDHYCSNCGADGAA